MPLHACTQGIKGWGAVLDVYRQLTAKAAAHDAELPNYQVSQPEVNGLVQGIVEPVWHTTLDTHPER